jgi:thiamine pyrophosphate-dependent acetolactate synthase large subunit-like protein
MNGTQFIARILKEEGVEQMTCFPSNALIEEVSKEGIRPVMFRHERGAVMAADGFARSGGGEGFGTVMMQHAAGAENSMGGLSQAFGDNVPMLVLPGGYPLEQRNVRPNFAAVNSYGSVVKSVEAIDTPTQIGDVMRRAFQALRNGRRGPVVVEMTLDVCAMEVPEEAMNYTSPTSATSAPSAGDIKDAVKLLLAARKPMIWSGAGVLFSGASAALTELAELTGIPVFTTMEGKSGFDERHPLSLGAGSGATTGQAHKWIVESDVIIGLGTSFTHNSYCQRVPDGKTVIHNTTTEEDVNKSTPSDIALIGDARLTIEAMIDEIKGQIGEGGRDTGVAAEIAAVKAEWMKEWQPMLEVADEPLSPYRVIWEIENNIDQENSIVTHDAGGPRDAMVPFLTATVPHSYMGWGKTTHLGFGIPAMIGAKMANPDKFCLNYMGDGAFGMSGLDVATAAKANLPITTVLLNNGGMATYPGGFPVAREQYDVSFMAGNYAQIAEGMGATGIVVSKVAEMGPAIKKARQLNAEGKTVLIDVHSNFEAKKSRF